MMAKSSKRKIIIVGGGTAGAVLAARLSEDSDVSVTLLEAGPDHSTYDAAILEPAQAGEAWSAGGEHLITTPMHSKTGAIAMAQGRLLGGTSAINGLATLRGQPADYDAWAAAGLSGWGWRDVVDTFITAENDKDFGPSALHGNTGPLPVRRWRKDELARSQSAFLQAMTKAGHSAAADINDASQLPGIGIFPVTINQQSQRVSTSLAYLSAEVRARHNLHIRTHAEVAKIEIDCGRAKGVVLISGEQIEADEVVLSAGAIWSPTMLLRSGVGPKQQLAEYGIKVHADLPVGSTMSDHLGAGILYHHTGPRGGDAGPAQVVLAGASNGSDVDYHLMPISLQDPKRNPLTFKQKLQLFTRSENTSPLPDLKTLLAAMKFLATPTRHSTLLMVAVFLLQSSGRGSVRLGKTATSAPRVVAPPLPEQAPQRLRHAFDQLAVWEQSTEFKALQTKPVLPHDLTAPDAVAMALQRNTISYGHMAGTCPMGTVLDAECRVHGIANLRVADASVMPLIPRGNTYLGCVMVAERIASKMKVEIGLATNSPITS